MIFSRKCISSNKEGPLSPAFAVLLSSDCLTPKLFVRKFPGAGSSTTKDSKLSVLAVHCEEGAVQLAPDVCPTLVSEPGACEIDCETRSNTIMRYVLAFMLCRENEARRT